MNGVRDKVPSSIRFNGLLVVSAAAIEISNLSEALCAHGKSKAPNNKHKSNENVGREERNNRKRWLEISGRGTTEDEIKRHKASASLIAITVWLLKQI